jgi:AcrR family transcriptional regulator
MTERPYHHGNLRRALLDAAERTVRERGVQDLSLRELAREVGVSHGAPRRHFPDRQALLDALAESGFDRLGRELRAAVDGAGDDFEQRLRATGAAYIRFATEDPAMLELILQGQAEGRLESGDPERVGLVLFAAIQGIASLLASGMVLPEQLDELLDDSIASFLRGSRSAV